MKQVLAAVDLSPMSRRVADRARILAEAHQAELKLVHVAEPPDVPLPDKMLERIHLYRQSQAEDLLTWINARARCQADLVFRSGNMAIELAKLSRQAGVVITGTSSVDQTRIGPRTTRLARKLHASVLSVRRLLRSPYRRAIAAVDLSDASASAGRSGPSPGYGRRHGDGGGVTADRRRDDASRMRGSAPERLDVLRRGTALHAGGSACRSSWPAGAAWSRRWFWTGPRPRPWPSSPGSAMPIWWWRPAGGAGNSNMVLLGSNAEALMGTVPCDVAIARVPGPVLPSLARPGRSLAGSILPPQGP